MAEGKKVKDTSVCTVFSQLSTKKRVNVAVITSAEARFHVLFSSCANVFFFKLIYFIFLPECLIGELDALRPHFARHGYEEKREKEQAV